MSGCFPGLLLGFLSFLSIFFPTTVIGWILSTSSVTVITETIQAASTFSDANTRHTVQNAVASAAPRLHSRSVKGRWPERSGEFAEAPNTCYRSRVTPKTSRRPCTAGNGWLTWNAKKTRKLSPRSTPHSLPFAVTGADSGVVGPVKVTL